LSDKIVGMAKSIEANSDGIRNHKALTQAMELLDLDVVKQEWDEAEEILFLFCTPRWGRVTLDLRLTTGFLREPKNFTNRANL